MHQSAAQPLVVGLSHERVPLDLLGRVSVRKEALPAVLPAVVSAGFTEAVVLSTCSRTEIYAVNEASVRVATARALDLLAAWSGLPVQRLEATGRVLAGRDAVAHLFRVTAGLESRLVGDVDVHAQVRSAWRAALHAGTAGSVLGRLFPASLRCAQRVRTRTALGDQRRSLARSAVDVGLAATTADPDVLVVGSGRMAAIACEHLAAAGRRFAVAARDEAYAARLAGPGRVWPLHRLVEGLRGADLLLCATSAAHHVVTLEHVRAAMSGREHPLVVVDLAVPGNVDARVGGLADVRLVDLAALGDDACSDPAVTLAVEDASRLVDAAARRSCEDLAAQDAGALIAALRGRVTETCLKELRRRPGAADPDATAKAAHAVAGKLLHRPTLLARAAASAGDRAALLLLCEAFGVAPEHVWDASGRSR